MPKLNPFELLPLLAPFAVFTSAINHLHARMPEPVLRPQWHATGQRHVGARADEPGRRAGLCPDQIPAEERDRLAPGIDRLLWPVTVTVGRPEGVTGAIV